MSLWNGVPIHPIGSKIFHWISEALKEKWVSMLHPLWTNNVCTKCHYVLSNYRYRCFRQDQSRGLTWRPIDRLTPLELCCYSVAKLWLMQYRWYGLAAKPACVSTRTIKVSLHAFTTLDISAVLSHYGWTFTPFKRNPSPPTAEKAKSQLYVWRDVKTAALWQTCWDLPISGVLTNSFRVIRGPCDLNSVYRMGLRAHMRQITGLSLAQ